VDQTQQLRRLLETWIRQVATSEDETVGPADDRSGMVAALAANEELVQHLTSTRWAVVLDALEAGADWDDLSSALGLSRGAVWSQFCQQTDRLPSGDRDALRASAIKDPLRGRRYR